MNKYLTSLLITAVLCSSELCFAGEGNDLKSLFLANRAKICGINIRNFNAKDTNGNGIIDENEESGNFLNAVERLDELKSLGINTLHVLPVTPTGKLKALGTAGSVYAISDFTGVNPQMVNWGSDLPPKEQLKIFVNECHKRGIRVIADLPSCGSYDLFLKRPELFIKDDKNLSIVPSDWTDVRLLNAGNNQKLNKDLMDEHKKFVDFVMETGFDGIRADVATIKPSVFWTELIKYAREKDSEFLFLAEASDSWREPPSKYAEFTPYDELLAAGFDGYYGSFFNLKEWSGKDLIEHIKFNNKLLNSYSEPKSVIMSFTTHDEVSPVVLHGEDFSVMIAWLEAVLPYNPYIIDGFATGDDYVYPWANTKAAFSDTDDDYYFVHRGKLDIFNFSRKPHGKSTKIQDNLKKAYKFRTDNEELVTKGTFIPLKVSDKNIFAFFVYSDGEKLLVIGNLNFDSGKERLLIKDSKIKKNPDYEIITGENNVRFGKKRLTTGLKAGEIKVIKIK